MGDQGDVLGQAQGIEPRVQIACMVHETVGAVRGPIRRAHAQQVGGQAAGPAGHVGDDVAPQVGRGGVAVQKHHRVALAGIDGGQLHVQGLHPASGMGIGGGD